VIRRGIESVECEGFNLQKDQDGTGKCPMLTPNFFLPIHRDDEQHDGAGCCCRDDAPLNYE
jgi:hypothetical protein